ncbi:toxin-antitoxin system YwqK family antitoxin [Mucilaginibacter sp. L3T2-6]|uniref:toxin-antitoxin system YwqK family antitoxin n=1 Tax=Mucilaginibacter sp. L3T2-6 TaxID=3062491 RepID=UPI0026770272|nr:hypothetical protein [Mucilaginibacter sp. L3T2-6]MDO3645224.1 hypothetical protein [Mucilaginibacter sp. L3T2-6]MDV6217676.1 hypothetical protein [Mucilaginibacter sp. L3T2-6]
MKKLLLIIISFFALTAKAQKMPGYGLYKIHLTDSGKTIVAEINLASEKQANPKLYYHWYTADGLHVTQGGYEGKVLNGAYNEYYLNKSIKMQGTYLRGLQHNTWKSWNAKGFLTSIYTWNKGVLNGEYSLFDGKGRLIEQGYYKNGLLNGVQVSYLAADSIKQVKYENGKPVPSNSSFWPKLNPARLWHHEKADTISRHK